MESICKAIETCGQNGVTSLKVGDIEILFGTRSIAPNPPICDNKIQEVDNDVNEEVDEEVVDEESTMLEDPFAYEMQQLKELGEQ